MKIVGCTIGDPVRCAGSHGDLWATAWGPDDTLYCISDDSLGFDHSCNSNLALHRLTGSPPNIRGETINPMIEYGSLGETLEDGAMWKACGITCVDGILYMTVSRHVGLGLTSSPYPVQEAWDSSIIMSTDLGATWSPRPKIGQSMFPGRTFATPSFVQYGKDGRGKADGADEYIYAVSSNGAWNNASGMTLGRVPRERISRLDPGDWEFVVNWVGDTPIWGSRHDVARLVYWRQNGASMTGVHFIESLSIYVMPQWFYTHLDTPDRRWTATCLEFYESPTPWGPWRLFHSQRFEPEGWYNPCIPNKFVADDGSAFWVFVSGDWTKESDPNGPYGLFQMPARLEIERSI